MQEFWRRWHISLSTWFRDYLYIPLGGNRVGAGAHATVNLVTVFFLCGLWHGASWNFVIWGLFHGLFLVLERRGLGRRREAAWAPLRHVYALLVVMVGWVFFRAGTLQARSPSCTPWSERLPRTRPPTPLDSSSPPTSGWRSWRGWWAPCRSCPRWAAGARGSPRRPRRGEAGSRLDPQSRLHGGSRRAVRGLLHVDRRGDLQPVHLLPVLMATRTLFCDPPEDAVSRAPALAPARSRQDGLLSIAFLALTLLPGLANTSGFDRSGGSATDGKPAPFPTLERSWASLGSFGARVQAYVQENFGFRKQLIRGHALLTAQVLHISPSPTVLWGREGWLYYAGDAGAEDIIAKTPFTEAELQVWQTTLIHNRDWLRARGVEYVFALAPDKPEIYPEYLPPSPRRLGTRNRMDQLAAHLRDHTDLVVVDLKTPLLEAKTRERVFDRTDTHWNRRGAMSGTARSSARWPHECPAWNGPGRAPISRPLARSRRARTSRRCWDSRTCGRRRS